jgi:Tfp pilus assembly protein PilF
LEVSYIELAYAVLNQKDGGFDKALEILSEGLELLPSSIWLKHAIARYYIYNHNSELSAPIYRELLKTTISDQALKWELSEFSKLLFRGTRKIDNMV